MRYHIITVIILLVAIVLYTAGFFVEGSVGLIAGAALETWFWVRMLVNRPSGKDDSSTIS